jgi:hypothetical protein
MTEAARTSETSVANYFTRQYIPEDNSELSFSDFTRNIILYMKIYTPDSSMFYHSVLALSIIERHIYILNFVFRSTIGNSDCGIAPNKVYKISLHDVADLRCRLQAETQDTQKSNSVQIDRLSPFLVDKVIH